jgi:hypothetical protein
MTTRVKLDLDPETFGRLVTCAVEELRSADWQAEVILMRALGTWTEPTTGYGAAGREWPDPEPDPPTD